MKKIVTKAIIKKSEKKNKMGRRPISLSAEQIKDLEEMASNMTIGQIADYMKRININLK